MANQMDKMSCFVTGVADLLREECNMAMLHDYMTVARIMMYEK